ncbi:hypothetical protein PPACK8108_LOCUS10617 [Phakopsora pachyrhizi]|uniref:Uncharacterized protein n=1 Tax=Phakopsora pachyrhizi TaxID=170000 RepID=A0AAV0AYP5_PHAPC|nr:hypothetical protein PPACK8108_LOCUS10617 [Phakopsora pachyrhizi]
MLHYSEAIGAIHPPDNTGERLEWGEGGGPVLEGRDDMGENGAGREGKVTASASGSFDKMGRVGVFVQRMVLSIGREGKRIEESSSQGGPTAVDPPMDLLGIGTDKATFTAPSGQPCISLQGEEATKSKSTQAQLSNRSLGGIQIQAQAIYSQNTEVRRHGCKAGAWTRIQGPTWESAPTEEYSHILGSVQDGESSPFSPIN